MTEAAKDLEQLEATLMAQIDAAGDEEAIEALRVSAIGKKGVISERMKTLGKMSADERQIM
ncbi:MAG: phenylalanine--tRNA ligase subunit alpha, partial [Pseudomonadota bacterium]